MNVREILALYDKDQRIDVRYPGTQRIVTRYVIRHVALTGYESMVLYSEVDEATAEAAVQEELAFFSGIGHSFEWKVYDHDRPVDLVPRLERHGFQVGSPEAIMALDMLDAPAELLAPVRFDIRRIDDPGDLGQVIAVEEYVWNEDFAGLAERLAHDLSHHPDLVSVFVAYVDGLAASAAWIYHDPGSAFASLWGGATMPVFRRLGLYTGLLATRVQEAKKRGARYLTVDAGPMSQPILERFGFHRLTYAHPCVWSVKP